VLNYLKIVAWRFGNKGKCRTFAIPFEKKGYQEFLKRLKQEKRVEKT
jgi:hypothetical protein